MSLIWLEVDVFVDFGEDRAENEEFLPLSEKDSFSRLAESTSS